jgi:large subunit ribosomal protein L33
MAKKDRPNIIMRSTESSYFYTTDKNKRNKEKLEMTSYDPTEGVRKHVLFKEEKMR